MEVDEDRLLVARHSKQRKKENPTSRHSKKALSPVEEEGEGEHPADSGASNGIGDDVREEAPSKPKGKGKVKSGPMKRKKKSKSKLTTVESTTYTEDGLRRGTRRRFRPLEYWRGERLILGRSENGPAPCPVVKTLYELPPEFHEPLGVAGRKRKRHGRSQSGSRPPPSKDRVDSPHDLVPPEEGWDADTPLQGPTLDFDTGAEITRRVAVTARNMEPGEVPSGHFAFQKVFLDGDFIASGVITIPVGGKKPLKGARDNTFVFFCHTGAVRARIHSESYILAPGGTFLVPRGNQYEIVNISKRECVLFFAQARVMMREELDGPDPAGSSAARSSIAPSARSSLAATPTKSGIAPGSKFKASGSAKRRS
ncbi:Mif2/CENP-C like-domain-containing protein [Cantharellus anzutake]|uniref:Mif2/CENP-C like-domain-containing protein n=1 Tax=Cantharellus anzutake TaxID=1750568 RepID=UPI001905E78C|nr:Mif2/CENP-C like-domain-containing protein [Cantharellus anzutake]KAF8344155.1 Mif2/CENP-C like-domain-containing protein [Cantharellus anzutake]